MVRQWLQTAADRSNFEVIITVDAGDTASFNAAVQAQRTLGDVPCTVAVQESAPFNCVKGWNLAASLAKGKVLIAISDDFMPIKQWDARLLAVSDPGWIDRPSVVMVNDCYTSDLCTLSIITKARYDQLGYLFYPGYESMFCDTELTYHAIQDGILIRALHLAFVHHHPDNEMRNRDGVDLVHSSSARYASGGELFKCRKAVRFPKDN
jgi:hypothetical protein